MQFTLKSSLFVRFKDTVRKKTMWPTMAYSIKQTFPKIQVFEARTQSFQVYQFLELYESFSFFKNFHIYFFRCIHPFQHICACLLCQRRKSYWCEEMWTLVSPCIVLSRRHASITSVALSLSPICWPDARQESSILKTDSRGIMCFVFGSKYGEILIYQD